MTQKQKEQLVKYLLRFVKRATKAEATPQEVAALAEVAEVLVDIEKISL